jgi:hypothetical protein
MRPLSSWCAHVDRRSRAHSAGPTGVHARRASRRRRAGSFLWAAGYWCRAARIAVAVRRLSAPRPGRAIPCKTAQSLRPLRVSPPDRAPTSTRAWPEVVEADHAAHHPVDRPRRQLPCWHLRRLSWLHEYLAWLRGGPSPQAERVSRRAISAAASAVRTLIAVPRATIRRKCQR